MLGSAPRAFPQAERGRNTRNQAPDPTLRFGFMPRVGIGAFVGLVFVGFFSYMYETNILSVPSQAHVAHHPSSIPTHADPQPAPGVQLML